MINPATGLEMTLADSLTAIEYEKLREERYAEDHAANAVWSEEQLMWVASAGITAAPVEVSAPVAAPVAEETPTDQAE
jgi:tRNA A37 threonylcarbamoyladenosine dehydratase